MKIVSDFDITAEHNASVLAKRKLTPLFATDKNQPKLIYSLHRVFPRFLVSATSSFFFDVIGSLDVYCYKVSLQGNAFSTKSSQTPFLWNLYIIKRLVLFCMLLFYFHRNTQTALTLVMLLEVCYPTVFL